MNEVFQGTPASSGIALGQAYVLKSSNHLVPKKFIKDYEIDFELQRFQDAIETSRSQITQDMNASDLEDNLKEVFEMQLLLLEDPMLISESIEKIKNQKINSEKALVDEIINLKSFLLKSKNPVFQDRVADLEDMGNRILSNLMGIPQGDIRIPLLQNISPDAILVAHDISPSLMLHIRKVAGIIVEEGGITGHMVILAKSRGIPCLVNTEGITDAVKSGDELMLDAISGMCVLSPDKNFKETFEQYKKREETDRNLHIKSPIIMQDNHSIELWANLSDPRLTQDIRLQDSSGIGLFRTEFLYHKETDLLVNHQKQKELYTSILSDLREQIITFRLLDISDDKPLPHNALVKKKHLSGVQFLLANIKITRMQIRSILEASIQTAEVHNKPAKIRLMIPMVSMIEEVEEIKDLCKDIEAEISSDLNINFTNMPSFELGIMLETPASVFMIEELNEVVDFFSVGSNDLAHLLMGLPRQNINATTEDLFFQPALYRIIAMIVTKAKKEISICGEIASRIDIIPLLLGMGIHKLSLSVQNHNRCATLIQKIKLEDCKMLSQKALQCKKAEELHSLLINFISGY